MPSTNGHKKTAVLYCRVSTAEQAEKGYSLAQQLEALREYASREGYEVIEEVTDPGQSGALPSVQNDKTEAWQPSEVRFRAVLTGEDVKLKLSRA